MRSSRPDIAATNCQHHGFLRTPDNHKNDENKIKLMKILSIVTIVKDHKAGFLNTAESIVANKPEWCEWIVVDGASTDGTAEAASEIYGTHMDAFLSEPDGGIADAFNKGVALSRGKYLLFLNAGDVLFDPSFHTLERILSDHEEAPVIVGRVQFGSRTIGRRVSFRQQMMRNHLPHQAMLIQKEIFKSKGMHDVSFKFAMDYEWTLHLSDIWDNITFSNEIISNMEEGGTATINYTRVFDEYIRARYNVFGFSIYSHMTAYVYIVRMYISQRIKFMHRSSES